MSDTPIIYEFMDYRDFLRAWLESRQSKLTHSGFAKMVGVSKAYLSMVLKGQRDLDQKLVPRIGEIMGLEDQDIAYFSLMVAYIHGAPPVRSTVTDRIVSARTFHGLHARASQDTRVVSSWYIGAIAELALCEGFRADAEWLASYIRPEITVEQAQEALDLLFERGSLYYDDDGRVQRSNVNYMTDKNATDDDIAQALRQQYQDLLEAAKTALDTVPYTERNFSNIKFPFPASRFRDLQAKSHDFMETMVHMAVEAEKEHTDMVYVVALQMFPLLSRPIDD